MLDIKEQDYDEVVALCINNEIYFGQSALHRAKENKSVDGLILRANFKFMSEFDLSPKWAEYVEYPTLFKLSEYNEWIKLPTGRPIC